MSVLAGSRGARDSVLADSRAVNVLLGSRPSNIGLAWILEQDRALGKETLCSYKEFCSMATAGMLLIFIMFADQYSFVDCSCVCIIIPH